MSDSRGSAAETRTPSDRILLWIFKRFPPSDPIFKDPGPRPETEYADEVHRPFYRWFGQGPEMFAGKDVLDLGCGFGGRPVRYAEIGARQVTGVEIGEELMWHAAAFAQSRGVDNVRFLVGTGEKIPCAAEQFDLITMFDVMEHVVSPSQVLMECFRVLRQGGRLAAVFPPYYALRSGSHLHGYATSFPGLNLIFTTKALRSAATHLLRAQGIEYWRYLRQDVPTDKLWNMNGATIRSFRALIKRSGFHLEKLRFIGEYDRFGGRHKGAALLLRLPFYLTCELGARTPFLQELLCGRVCVVLRK